MFWSVDVGRMPPSRQGDLPLSSRVAPNVVHFSLSHGDICQCQKIPIGKKLSTAPGGYGCARRTCHADPGVAPGSRSLPQNLLLGNAMVETENQPFVG